MIIALGHKSRVGKDTAALLLEEYATQVAPHIGVRRCGFAWQVKETAEGLYKWAGLKSRSWYEAYPEMRTQVLPEVGKTPVQLWTAVGDAMTAIHPMTLVQPVLSWASEGLGLNSRLLIVSDLRRESEINGVHSRYGYVVKVIRPDAPKNVSSADNHLDHYGSWDYILVNDGSMETLKLKVKSLFWEVYRRCGGEVPHEVTGSICPYCHGRDISEQLLAGDPISMCRTCPTSSNPFWACTRNREILAQPKET